MEGGVGKAGALYTAQLTEVIGIVEIGEDGRVRKIFVLKAVLHRIGYPTIDSNNIPIRDANVCF